MFSGERHSNRVELNLGLGHSGAQILPAIVKKGEPEAMVAEALHLKILGPNVAPAVYAELPGMIVMEWVTNEPMLKSSLMSKAQNLLQVRVWNRSCPLEHLDQHWTSAFKDRFRFAPPQWVKVERPCMIHGDPTLANTIEHAGFIRLIDPKPPGRGIPSFKSVDRGKMLQSLMGWEKALDPDCNIPEQVWPFLQIEYLDLLRAIWWCMMHFIRIQQREKDSPLGCWAQQRAELLEEIVRGEAKAETYI